MMYQQPEFDEYGNQIPRRKSMNWFQKMEGLVKWKVIGPDINNPFAPIMSDRALIELAHKREVLRRMFNIRCMCDGHEVLMIRNIENPQITSDHPCISILSKDEIFKYLESHGVLAAVSKEMDRVQAALKEELLRRDQEVAAQKEFRERTKAALRGKNEEQRRALQSGFRVVRR